MIGARTRCLWGENLCATSSTFAGRCHMIGKVVTGCVAILPYHTATQDRGSECRDFGFISRIVQLCKDLCPHKPCIPVHTHPQHARTHTHTPHVGFYGLRGLSIGVMVFICTNCMCYCPTPTLHLNLALTGDSAFLLSPQKTHLYDF